MSKIQIGIPTHGGSVSVETWSSIKEAERSSAHNISHQCIGLSLLALNFNSLWVTGYKTGADFFVLHHSDLGVHSPHAGRPWIDVLVDKMYQLSAAAISVASPIKSTAGHLSAGLQMVAGNPHTLRRLTVRELNLLPESFIARCHVCEAFGANPAAAGAMLVNTGLLIIDLRRFPWAGLRWPGFEIKDQIAWNLRGEPLPYTVPEDWAFSMWMHEHGLPYFMTRELQLVHAGHHTFKNHGIWGDAADFSQPKPSIAQWSASGMEAK